MDIQRVGVVGCGLMGSGIAEASARAGLDVRVVDLDQASLERGRERVVKSIARAKKAGKLTEADAEAALGRIEFSTDIGILADRQLVIEAVVEAEAEKVAVFEALDTVVADPAAVLASNTSSIPIMKLAMATGRPAQVMASTSSTRCRSSRWSNW
jgi:3-hydroxybutyryl-CoA dehydrogenase